MGIIQQLDEVTINQIAAGEVIDRPASIVKELLENALDAGATRIDVTLVDGGKQGITISDNGSGISKDDFPKAFLRHATSKIRSISDVTGVATLGFRGEALASICHVAQVTVTSSQTQGEGLRMHVYQDQFSEITEVSASLGTTIEVTDLFADLPVRRNFLKSGGTELSHIYDVVLKFSLCFPHVDFVLQQLSKTLISTVGISDQPTLLQLHFSDVATDMLFPVQEEMGSVTVSGIIASPHVTFSTRQKMIVMVNGRLVQSPVIYKAIQDSYKELIPARRFPLVLLHIQLDGEVVDVNIHPQKMDVKFVSSGFLYDCIPKIIRVTLQKASASHAQKLETISTIDTGDKAVASPAPFSISHAAKPLENVLSDFSVSESVGLDPSFGGASVVHPGGYRPSSERPNEPLKQFQTLYSDTGASSGDISFLQVFDTYLVFKTADGLYMLDQHAVHERILYEEFQDGAEDIKDRQVLLVPDIVSVDVSLMGVYEAYKEDFMSFNFIIDVFGEDQLAIREVPVILAQANASILIVDLLEDLKEYGAKPADLRVELKPWLQMRACKAAIKAGKKMSQLELKQLLKDFVECPSNFTCPHGRPLYIHYTKKQLESLFLRV